MTKEELQNDHLCIPENHNYSRIEHAKISIRYAISILEDADNEMLSFMKGSRRNPLHDDDFVERTWKQTKWHQTLAAKIQELKSQL